jgi:hypothetical protein
MATYTSDGSPSDIQAKVNGASAGDTVSVPSGSYTWTAGVKVFAHKSRKVHVLKLLLVSKKSAVLTEPLFSDLDRRRCISLVEVSEVTGFPPSQLRIYSIDGTIPGGRQAALGPRSRYSRLVNLIK